MPFVCVQAHGITDSVDLTSDTEPALDVDTVFYYPMDIGASVYKRACVRSQFVSRTVLTG